jgi:AraC-like DNA-binding protein
MDVTTGTLGCPDWANFDGFTGGPRRGQFHGLSAVGYVDDHVAAEGCFRPWVIRRYRLHEAAERAGREPKVDWPRLATDLGYYDQAHLIRDFTAIVGISPAHYSRATANRS